MGNIYYQKEGLSNLFEAREENGQMSVSLQSGGFVSLYSHEEFNRLFKEFKPDLSLKKGTVSAQFLKGNVKVPCYSNRLTWNGWGMPRFDREGVDLVMKAFDFGPKIKYHFEGDILTMDNPEYDEKYPEDHETKENVKTFKINPTTKLINGVPILLWYIGENWCWEAVVFDES